jgi:hypothetical protein
MVLFPIALLWLIGVIVWVVRNEAKPGQERKLDWRRWRPRPPRLPRGGRAGGAEARAGRRERRPAHARRERTLEHDSRR